MKALSGRDFCRLLERKGWILARVAGSHHIYVKEGAKERISVPVHGNQALKIGLQTYLMKIADISSDYLT